jgi:NAD+ kinase
MNKYHFIFDKTKRSKKFKKIVLQKYNNFSLKKSDIIIVAGGDGLMLKTIKKYFRYNKPFYGINCGSVGFLMNKYNSKKFTKELIKQKL